MENKRNCASSIAMLRTKATTLRKKTRTSDNGFINDSFLLSAKQKDDYLYQVCKSGQDKSCARRRDLRPSAKICGDIFQQSCNIQLKGPPKNGE
jgi:hypothetical protein